MTEPSIEFWNRVLPSDARQAGIVGSSFIMVVELPRSRDRATTPTIEIACLEAWFVHMRLLIEFFGLKPGGDSIKDFSAKSAFWKPERDQELCDLWVTASQHVVHFSLARTPDLIEDIAAFDVSTENLERLARKVLGVASMFVKALEYLGDATAQALRVALDDAHRILPN